MPDPATVPVPNVVNLPRSEAEEKLKAVGLVGVVTTANSSTTPTGSVSSANPAAGTLVSLGSSVNLEVSGEPQQIKVPNLRGLTKLAAEHELTKVGLVVGKVKSQHSDSVPIGDISSTNPDADTLVSLGSSVDLEVSGEPQQVKVPNLWGLTKLMAENELTKVGLVVGKVKSKYSHSVPKGGVTHTIPPMDTLLSPGKEVDLHLSSGPEPQWTQYILPGFFVVLGIIVLGVIGYVITQDGQRFLTKLSDKEIARGLITFLIAITTVGVAIILAISTLALGEGDAGDKRFDRGKQVLSVLIGVLGTIVGFYFGSAVETKTAQQTLAITTTMLPDGGATKPYSSTTLRAAGGIPPLTWFVTPPLPDALTLDPATGMISGTPKAASQKSTFTFAVTDSAKPAASAKADLTLEIK